MARKIEREKILAIQKLWDELPREKIAQILGIHPHTVSKIAGQLGLPPKKLPGPLHLNLSLELQETLDGLLLGGHAVLEDQKSAYFVACSQNKKYLEWIDKLLGLERQGQGFYKTKSSWVYVTRSYYELIFVRKRWYPKGEKEIPPDIRVTPKILLLWFIRAGHIEITHKKRRQAIRFWVWRYQNSVKYLLLELERLGLSPSYYKGNRTAMIRIKNLSNFFDYIGPCPEELEKVFGYKWKWNQ